MLKLDKRKIEVIENNDFQKEIKEDIIDTTKPSST